MFFSKATYMMYSLSDGENLVMFIIGSICQLINISFLLLGMFSDPGIPKGVIDLYVRMKFNPQSYTEQ
mgnify:CR=1 FL=1